MNEINKMSAISRRKALSLMGVAAAFGFAASSVAVTTEAEAQTVGMERRQDRRTGRHDRRQARRTNRVDRREAGSYEREWGVVHGHDDGEAWGTHRRSIRRMRSTQVSPAVTPTRLAASGV